MLGLLLVFWVERKSLVEMVRNSYTIRRNSLWGHGKIVSILLYVWLTSTGNNDAVFSR